MQFYNSAVAIIIGCGAAALSFRLRPPVSPAFRTRRLLALKLRDLRHLAIARIPQALDDWKSLVYSRLAVLPDEAQPLQGSQLLTALSAGAAIIQLRRVARQLDLSVALDDALGALAQGRGAIAMAQSASLDRVLAAHADLRPFDRRLLGREAYPRVIGGADPAFRLLRRRNARVRFIENKLFGVYVAPMQMPQGGGCLIPAW